MLLTLLLTFKHCKRDRPVLFPLKFDTDHYPAREARSRQRTRRAEETGLSMKSLRFNLQKDCYTYSNIVALVFQRRDPLEQ